MPRSHYHIIPSSRSDKIASLFSSNSQRLCLVLFSGGSSSESLMQHLRQQHAVFCISTVPRTNSGHRISGPNVVSICPELLRSLDSLLAKITSMPGVAAVCERVFLVSAHRVNLVSYQQFIMYELKYWPYSVEENRKVVSRLLSSNLSGQSCWFVTCRLDVVGSFFLKPCRGVRENRSFLQQT